MAVQPYGDFTGNTVIVTGAGSGIGCATARAFARAHVLGVGCRKDALAETAMTIRGSPRILATCAPRTRPWR